MSTSARPLSIAQILWCGGLIVTLSMGIRHGFGLWQQPVIDAHGWTREQFSIAMALQNLSWGLFAIFSGMVADRFGAFRVLVGGAVLYALGLMGMAHAATPLPFALTAGLLIGAAQAATTYSVIYGVIGRQVAPERRSWAMGLAGAAGSFGQFLMLPIEGRLIDQLGWQLALIWLAVSSALIIPLSFGLREGVAAAIQQRQQTISAAVREAFAYPSFRLLMAGYFVCGFQLAFIGIHMPINLKDAGLPAHVASYALALVGLFNVFGTYAAGALGQRYAKSKILAVIYLARAGAITAFLAVPISPASVYVFAAAMGLLWLSTVPVTNAVIAQIFGVAHLSMLAGFVFFSHQVGSFLGVWLGGRLYDMTGTYQIVWYIAIALGVFAAVVNLGVRETAIARPQAQAV